MATITGFKHVNTLRQPAWLTILRILLGGMLFIKGIIFISDTTKLEALLQASRLAEHYAPWLVSGIAWANILCGLFILCGLLTRLCCLFQIPMMLVAIFAVNIPNRTITNSSELALSIFILVLLIIFLIEGSGRLSADEYFRTYYKEGNK